MDGSILPGNSAKRILIIEDDKAIYHSINLLLTHYGFDVTVASTMHAARKLYRKPFDLIVLDVMLPDGNALDLLQQIRFSGENARVFVLTGNTQADVDRQIHRLVPEKHFHKPFNFFEILDAIRAAF